MITYKFTNAGGVDVEYLTDGQGDATNELLVVETRGLESADTRGGLDFDIYPYTQEQFEIFATANNLQLTKYEDEVMIEDLNTQSERTVEYEEQVAVGTIDPAEVTFDTDTFTVPADVVEFTFVDDSVTYTATFDGWNWTITAAE